MNNKRHKSESDYIFYQGYYGEGEALVVVIDA